MEKKQLVSILSEIFEPIGFKKKGDCWLIDSGEVIKIINLQKSQYGNIFYINYGYIVKAIPLNGLKMHIYKRMSSIDISENQRIEEVLNLENGLSNENREKEIRKFLLEKVVFNIQKVNTEKDLLNELNRLQNLNSIPMVVKRYFALEE